MRVIGTAGHVDHGKSTLVQALTGIHPDRLKEEREREMTIDLGFAWFTLPNGEPVGVVDVPGHRDFIENMLAGVGGIDAALLVVAADEGVMPQTREHLAILDLLQINNGVVALTKCDLVDADWINLVTEEVATLLKGTGLATAPIISVSARTGLGLADLRQMLANILSVQPPRPDLMRPRLPIDRVFTIAGFGTVVTGTLLDGALTVGDEVVILPGDHSARIRGLQTHKAKIERAVPGSRVAVNLTGVQISDLHRGDVLCYPNTLSSTHLLDVQLRHLADSDLPLKHNAEVKFFVGAAETLATARVLAEDSLASGAIGWLQLVLRDPIVVAKGDRFILRRPSPGATLGGGVVVDPHPARRHKRRDAALLARLETLVRGTPDEILSQALDALGPGPLIEAIAKSGLEATVALEAITQLVEHGDLIPLDPATPSPPFAPTALVASRLSLHRLTQTATDLLAAFHRAVPLKNGLPREELKSKLKLPAKVFNAFINWSVGRGTLAEAGALLKLPTHQVVFTPEQRASVDRLVAVYQRDPHNTPSLKDSIGIVGEDVLAVLLDRGDLIQVSPDVLFLQETYRQMVAAIKEHLQANGTITVAQVRDLFSTSRKYALALMEYLDKIGVTVRKGDERVLKKL
jgi:selenocysteine-specific elongation factor